MQEIVPHWLYKRKQLTPEKVALIYDNESWTYERLHSEVKDLAYRLHACGIKEKMHVGLLLDNSSLFVKLVYALSYLGATIVCLNIRLTENEINYQIKNSDMQWLITNRQILTDKKLHFLQTIKVESLPTVKPVVCPLQKEIDLNQPFTIMYTSGTTGKPKGVVHTYKNHMASAIATILHFGVTEKDRWLLCLPMYHIGGFSIIIRSVISGMSIYLLRKFEVDKVQDALLNKQISIASFVSVMLERLLDHLQKEDFTYPSTVRAFLLGGSSLSSSLIERAEDKKIPVFPSYGMTETTSHIATSIVGEKLRKQSSGKPLFSAQVKIVQKDEHGIGEVAVKGPMVSGRYYNKQTNDIKDGWFLTNDIGKLDEDGYLYILDRRNDLIISGGENIYPKEIERHLEKIEGVQTACVIGLKDDAWGEVPVACLEGKLKVSKSEVLTYLENFIARYKLPKYIYCFDELPRNSLGKIKRDELKQMIEQLS